MGETKQKRTVYSDSNSDTSGNSNIPFLKQPVTPGTVNLVIAVGGSGADMLREVKGLIGQNCCSDHDKDGASERVAYIAFDADPYQKDRVSSKETGCIKLADDELINLSRAAMRSFLDPSSREYFRKEFPLIYKWLDTTIPLYENEFIYYRQAGRVALFTEIQSVVESLRKKILKLIKGNGNLTRLNIYILSGLCGATGSGTFLDMAYIARQIAMEVTGLKYSVIRVSGYLLMPECYFSRTDKLTKPHALRYAGAALQELEHAMKLPETGMPYECQYSKEMTVRTYGRPFDHVHLIGTRFGGKEKSKDAYQRCIDAAAADILCFVTEHKEAKAHGRMSPEEFRMDDFYSNIRATEGQAATEKRYPERLSCYLSLGYDSYRTPADKLAKYTFTLMSKKASDLLGNEPGREDADMLLSKLGLVCEQRLTDILDLPLSLLDPMAFRAEDLFGEHAKNIEEYLPFNTLREKINEKVTSFVRNFEKKVKEELRPALEDIDRGPVWVHHLLPSGKESQTAALDSLIREQKQAAEQFRANAKTAEEACTAAINKMKETGSAEADEGTCREYIEAWNGYLRAKNEIYLCDLLIGEEAALKESALGFRQGVYDSVRDIMAAINDQWWGNTAEIFEELEKVVRSNIQSFEGGSPDHNIKGLAVPEGEIPAPDPEIAAAISESGIDQDAMMREVTIKLLGYVNKWQQTGGERKQVKMFLEEEARRFFGATFESVLGACLNKSKPLEKSIAEELIPSLDKNAEPLFVGDAETGLERLIIIPAGFDRIESAAKAYCRKRKHVNVFKSNLCSRISVINLLTGISLHEYSIIKECEKQVAYDPNDRGLFLYQGDSSDPGAVNHRRWPLPSVIPGRKWSVMGHVSSRIEKYEKDLIEEFREIRKGRYPFLKMEKSLKGDDYDLYILLSAGLDEAGFYEMTGEANYMSTKEEIDENKLRKLIEKLKEIRYQTGLPETSRIPKKLTVCKSLLRFATKEMKARYQKSGLSSEEVQKIKEEAAWEVAEWFYLSAYSCYMSAKEEKAKYDAVEKKIEELEDVLGTEEEKTEMLLLTAKMLASKTVFFDFKYLRYLHKSNGEFEELVQINPEDLTIREIIFFKKLQTLRKGASCDKALYEALVDRVSERFDKPLREAYEKAYDERSENGKYPEEAENIRTVIDIYKELDTVRQDAAGKKAGIVRHLTTSGSKPTADKNMTTLNFYSDYFETVEDELMRDGIVAAMVKQLGIVDENGNLLPEDRIFEKAHKKNNEERSADIGSVNRVQVSEQAKAVSILPRQNQVRPEFWNCPICGRTGNTGNFCPACASKGVLWAFAPGYWLCLKCGKENLGGNYCTMCGTRRP